MPILLKFTWPDGTSEKQKFNDDACVNDLVHFAKIQKPDTKPPSFYSGYPPVRLDYDSGSSSLSSIGIKSGQLITIKEGEVPYPLRRVIDADNSCLFNALSYACHRSRELFNPPEWRNVASMVVQESSEQYSEAILGKTPEAYSQWIRQETSWGGEIECK